MQKIEKNPKAEILQQFERGEATTEQLKSILIGGTYCSIRDIIYSALDIDTVTVVLEDEKELSRYRELIDENAKPWYETNNWPKSIELGYLPCPDAMEIELASETPLVIVLDHNGVSADTGLIKKHGITIVQEYSAIAYIGAGGPLGSGRKDMSEEIAKQRNELHNKFKSQ
jgi:hypothetical protein